jgi:ABC-2 type transport system permease protein
MTHVEPPTLEIWPVPLPRRFNVSALLTLFWLTLRQHVRGRRLLLLSLVFALPAVIAIVARNVDKEPSTSDLELGLVFSLFPHALLPFAALWYASGMIQDEVEEQTLTYLLIRPLPRWAIYLAKLVATMLLTCTLAAVFALLTYAALFAGTPEAISGNIPMRALKVALLFSLCLIAYCALFGLLSLLTRRSLMLGLTYIFILEGVIANIDFVARAITVVYYFRVLVERWLGTHVEDWSLDLNKAPTTTECLLTLAGITLVATILGSILFSAREFRLKTPEGS